jgi:hypothetical protein
MIVYDEIEPFGGLREDTQNLGWDEIKRNFLARNRPQGVYLYHKAKGSPSYCFFYVDNFGKAYQYIPFTKDNIVFNIYTNAKEYDEDLLQTLMIIKEIPQVYEAIKENILKEKLGQTVYDVLKRNTSKTAEIKIKFLNKYDNIWTKWKENYRISINDKSIPLSKDVEIISPTTDVSGTILAVIDNPKDVDITSKLGYTLNQSEITPTSKEKEYGDYYRDTTFRGKVEHDVRDDLVSAFEASKNTEIGWATNPSDIK